MANITNAVLQNTLTDLLKLLTDDELMMFNKIHRPLGELKDDNLIRAIDLVDRTLKKNGVEYVFNGPNIVHISEAGL